MKFQILALLALLVASSAQHLKCYDGIGQMQIESDCTDGSCAKITLTGQGEPKMDFHDILAQASHNAQKASKVVNSLNHEVNEQRQRKREQFERDLIREREEKRRKAPPKVEKKFVIPKKPSAPNKEVELTNAIRRLKEKERHEQFEREKQRRKDCEKLIGLRLQANQGKANKKIASQFGKTAIELQQRFAPNSHMELDLLKRQQREQEELDRQSTALRNSINRAKSDRAGALMKQQLKGPNKEKARIGNVRAGGFSDVTSKQEAVLTKRKAENFSTFSSNREKDKAKRPKIVSTGPPLDFKSLMEKAQQNTDVKNVAAKSDHILHSTQQQSASHSNSREVMKRAMNEQRSKTQQSSSTMKAAPSSKSAFQQPSSNRRDLPRYTHQDLHQDFQPSKTTNPYESSDRHVLSESSSNQRSQISTQKKPNRGDRPMPTIPQPPAASQNPQKEPRYLPGDIRYKGPPPQAKSLSNNKPSSRPIPTSNSDRFKKPVTSTSNGSTHSSMNGNKQKQPSKQRASSPDLFDAPNSSIKSMAQRQRDLFGDSPPRRYEKPSSMRKPDRRHDFQPASNPAMFGKRGHSSSSYANSSYLSGHNNYSDEEDEYDEEDDYSDLDGFIDDTDVNELETTDFEETLRSVNRNYNKNLWKMRERMIDYRRMDAKYRDIEAEEKRSSRLALMEDLMEAKKGSKGLE
ncbi:Protein SPT2-like protein [Aphelenchoides bicaudatus]|nr:Protein SPT2-like protein [Aphelenchoides bicaudatus]